MKKIVLGIIIVLFLALYGIAENHQRVQNQWGEWKELTLDGAHPEKPGFCLYCYIRAKFNDYKDDRQIIRDKYDVEVETLMYIDVTDYSLYPNIHYRKKGQAKRKWNREIYYSDMDSIIVCRWDSLTDKEKINAIRESFSFDLDESEWKKYSDSENLKMLLDNSFVEWK